MTALIRDFGTLARCERPSASVAKLQWSQPGRFAVGPEEKQGLLGFVLGGFIAFIGWLVFRPKSIRHHGSVCRC